MKFTISLCILLILPLNTSYADDWIEGQDAKNIMINGDVLGMVKTVDLFDVFFDERFTESSYTYSVRHENEFYHCYNHNLKKWACERRSE